MSTNTKQQGSRPSSGNRLTYRQILRWADDHHRRTGKWPASDQGAIAGAPGETWSAVNAAMTHGYRGLPAGTTLARFLANRRRREYPIRWTKGRKLSPPQIVAWAREHHARTGRWPTKRSGPVHGVPGETWSGIQAALFSGCRGFRGGSSLADFLDERFPGQRSRPDQRPRLTEAKILRWAKEHHARTGRWPNANSGPVVGQVHETWVTIDLSLYKGARGLPGGDSLPRLLQRRLHARTGLKKPALTVAQVRRWAEAHRKRTGRWPTVSSGAVLGGSGETWQNLDIALREGLRGLPGGMGLSTFLGTHPLHYPSLTIPQILHWADQHFRRTGRWPYQTAGAVRGAPGISWRMIDRALQCGYHGLPGGSRLSDLLVERRAIRRRGFFPPLTEEQILAWADAYRARTGHCPWANSGGIPEAPAESWATVNRALLYGLRGLRTHIHLGAFLALHHRQTYGVYSPRLSEALILKWARAHRRRTGRWPTVASGAIPELSGGTWSGVNAALRLGNRGLPGGSSLVRLLSGLPGYVPYVQRGSKARGRLLGQRRRPRVVVERPRRPLSLKAIMMWARAHHRRTGEWPERFSGRVADAPGETWRVVDDALQQGTRGLPGGSSLKKLLARRRAPASIAQLLAQFAAGRRRP